MSLSQSLSGGVTGSRNSISGLSTVQQEVLRRIDETVQANLSLVQATERHLGKRIN